MSLQSQLTIERNEKKEYAIRLQSLYYYYYYYLVLVTSY